MTTCPFSRSDPPLYKVTLWPHRSLGKTGFRNTMLLVIVGISIPMLPLILTTHSWKLLPFAIVPVALLYLFFKRNYRDGRLTEELKLWNDLITVRRIDPDGTEHRWHANPYWVSIGLRDQPVDNYLTLKGNRREIELGAFLTPEERASLKAEIEDALRALDINA